ncbi:hypothetical protein E8E13_002338 [Curvularia kusanoi]|uniref:Uncharacterized protein n=1 Tax=Curvularia kusanoi TaxID=90978 RepID=A0A9P4TDF7_CURKU|nr:hypothetical protein E8E13_002338 [Curvularia kusanoi]
MTKSRREAEAEVRSWGFNHVFTWTDGPNAHYPPHKHSGKTTHLILDGSLTMRYPNDAEPKKETLGVGERWDVDAQKVHEVWVGSAGCTYVIGE